MHREIRSYPTPKSRLKKVGPGDPDLKTEKEQGDKLRPILPMKELQEILPAWKSVAKGTIWTQKQMQRVQLDWTKRTTTTRG